MIPHASLDISRRQFLTAGGLTVAAACLAPGHLIAQTNSIVPGAFKEAATAKVTVQNLRRNISVLLGAGGNMAVLTGPDGTPHCNGGYLQLYNPDTQHEAFYGIITGVLNGRVGPGQTLRVLWGAPYVSKLNPNPSFSVKVTVKYFHQ